MEFYKKDKDSKIWWARVEDEKGTYLFSFDKKKTYNLFQDYPYKLSEEERRIFDKYEPFWAEFFSKRK